MSSEPTLNWLRPIEGLRDRLKSWRERAPSWADAVELANSCVTNLQTQAIDAGISHAFPDGPPAEAGVLRVRLAVLASSTVTHLLPAIRIGGARRGLWITTHEGGYGLFRQELLDPASALHAFRPDAILFAFDAHHLMAGVHASFTALQADEALSRLETEIKALWSMARGAFPGLIIHQTPLPVFPDLLGSNNHRLPGSRAALLARLNSSLRGMADEQGIQLLALDARVAREGLVGWHNPALWYKAKQEVAPGAAPVFGDMVARLIAAQRGRSFKCLVLDLDNTIWGGVVGDDGVDGLALGQGSALGEAFVAVQAYARDLAQRGVILAVVSKNDEANALEAFDRHPEMLLRRADIACFIANWADKATNLRAVAAALNIGLDSLVFVDDNPFERNLARAELPMVAVPEIPEDPALVPQCLADAGYFESLGLTADDRRRTAQYQANLERASARAAVTDMPTYLRGLAMRLLWRPFDRASLARITQLINKTNQFNLTTPRMSETEVQAVMDDPRAIGLQLRLIDQFGDNGIIGVVIGRQNGAQLMVDAWLMSCRVLGRGVERATLEVLVEQARRRGVKRVIGLFRPTAKNAMVADHYSALGFEIQTREPDGSATFSLDLDEARGLEHFMSVEEG